MSLDKQKINSGHNLCSLPCQVHVSVFNNRAQIWKYRYTPTFEISEGMDDLSDRSKRLWKVIQSRWVLAIR